MITESKNPIRAIEIIEKVGKIKRIESGIPSREGYRILPKWLKKVYIQAVNNKCQDCNKSGDEITLEIHKIHRKWEGGLYTLVPLNHKDNNIKVLCKDCHKKHHSKEKF
jgi:hypothetical protein